MKYLSATTRGEVLVKSDEEMIQKEEMMGQEKGKCKYCGKKIPEGCIRCAECDVAFQDGMELGRESSRCEIREALHFFLEILKEEKNET